MSREMRKAMIENFIKYKRLLGYKYDSKPPLILRHYCTFMDENYPDTLIPDKESTQKFIQLYQGHTGGLYNVLAVMRELSRYLIKTGHSEAYLIPDKQTPKLAPKLPYFFDQEGIEEYFRCCQEHSQQIHLTNSTPGIHTIIPAFFTLLYCCGLRFRECRTLKRESVNLLENSIDIIQSKGPKSRRIYISDELTQYLSEYNQRMDAIYPNRIYFFPSRTEQPLSKETIYYHHRKIWAMTKSSINHPAPPRIYDFRHNFACATINRWAVEGKDVNAELPYLSRYMGHTCIKHTLYYFHFVPGFYGDFLILTSDLNDMIEGVFEDEEN